MRFPIIASGSMDIKPGKNTITIAIHPQVKSSRYSVSVLLLTVLDEFPVIVSTMDEDMLYPIKSSELTTSDPTSKKDVKNVNPFFPKFIK